MKRAWVLIFVSFILLIPGISNAESQATISRLDLFDPDPSDVKNALDGMEAAIKTRDLTPTIQVGLLPSDLPSKLGEPEMRPLQVGPMVVNLLTCGNAYAHVFTSSSTNGGLIGSSNDQFFGCMYVSKQGIRISLVIQQSMQSSGGVMGMLLGGIRNTVRGDDKEFGKKTFDDMAGKVREKVPGVLVELEELPGGDVTHPDEDKIKALLASKESKPQTAPATVPAIPSQVPSSVSGATPDATANQPKSDLNAEERRIQDLKNLAALKASGVLSEQEFEEQKKKILGN